MDETPQLPSRNEDRLGWKAYWTTQGMPWRTEPEIDEERQQFLAERRKVIPDIEKGIFPFRHENRPIKLTRADVEWLLATYDSDGIVGPVYWSPTTQEPKPEGLDLRGADLRRVNLSGLPLARLRGGLTREERRKSTHLHRHAAAIRLEHADLDRADLQGAHLGRGRLEHANLEFATLHLADLGGAHLADASLRGAHLGGAYLRRAFFDGATNLDGIKIAEARYGSITIVDISWGNANLSVMDWSQVTMLGDEKRAWTVYDRKGKRKHRTLRLVEFRDAVRANRQLAIVLREQGLNEHANRFAYRAQVLERAVVRRQILARHSRWQPRADNPEVREPTGPRGPRQHLGLLLQDLRDVIAYGGSWLLNLLAGYGFKPSRTLLCYLTVVGTFALLYHLVGMLTGKPFPLDEALVFSITSFHGRGFFPGPLSLHDPVTKLAASEAVTGLLIEISFIATFTQRFFTR